MNTEAETANNDVASMVGKVEVNEHVMPALCKRPKVTHDTDRQQGTVEHLQPRAYTVSQTMSIL